MDISVCDMCEEAPKERVCKLCRADICDDSECAKHVAKHGTICVACFDEVPVEDFTDAERQEYGVEE